MLVKNIATSLAVIAALCAGACSNREPGPLNLLDSAEKEADGSPSISAEEQRLRQMQLVRVIDPENGTSVDYEPETFVGALADCGGFQGCDAGQLDPCELATCRMQKEMCQGELALAVASGTGTSVSYLLQQGPGEGTVFRVPTQSAASSAKLAVLAAEHFENVMKEATVALLELPATGTSCSLASLLPDAEGVTLRGFATAKLMDAFDSGKRAYRQAYQHTLAVSDAELSSSSQLDLARARAISKRELSRSAAAHLMVGGRPGWFGSTSTAFCTASRLTGPQEAALSILREAALAPEDVLLVSTDALVNGTTTGLMTSYGTARARLGDAWGDVAISPIRPLWERYGLTKSDFEAAHAALKDEIEIFGRTRTAKLQARQLPGGRTPDFERYAGAAGRAPDRPDEYWSLLAQFDAPEDSFLQEGDWRAAGIDLDDYFDGTPIGQDFLGGNLAGFVDRAYSWARLIVDRPELASVSSEVIDPLTLLLSSEDIRGRLMHCADRTAPTYVLHTIRVAGFEATDHLALVRGQDLMDCAVNGHIEGAGCVLPPVLSAATPALDLEAIRLTDETPSSTGPFISEVRRTFTTELSEPGALHGRYYLIRPRQKGDTDPRPGEWVLVAGTPLFLSATTGEGQELCRDVPIVPEATEAAAAAIAPSRDWCGTSEVSCAGTRFDERLALEDELSDDGDGVESSWKHYLELARSAVTHADALGQEYIAAALQDDLREEEVSLRSIQQQEKALGEFQRIQQICGTAARPDLILGLLGLDTDGDLDLGEVSNARCQDREDSPVVCGARLLVGQNPSLGEIAQCLTSFGDLVPTHLGDGFLCVADPGTSVPPNEHRIRVALACDECGPGFTCLTNRDGLGLFETASLVPAPTLPSLCAGIRELRAHAADDDPKRIELYQAIRDHYLFEDQRLAGLSAKVRVGYEGGSGAFVDVNVGPGFVASSRPGSELCGDANTACGANEDGLFCRKWDCADTVSRGDLNLRLFRGAAALLDDLPESVTSPRTARFDTVWYVNHFLRPTLPWSESPGAGTGQWRIFTVGNEPLRSSPQLFAAQASAVGAAFGAQQWTVAGPEPRVHDGPGAPEHAGSTSLPTRLAFRNAYFEPRSGGLAFDVLRNTSARSAPARVVRLSLRPEGAGEQAFGPGAIAGSYRDPQFYDEDIADLNYGNQNLRASNQSPADPVSLQRDLASVGLFFYNPSGGNQWSGIAPAAKRRKYEVIADATVFAEQVFPSPPTALGRDTDLPLDALARLDAIELACRGSINVDPPLTFDCGAAPAVTDFDSIAAVGSHLECLGNQIRYRAATAVYRLPQQARDYLGNGERVFDATGGDLHVAISDLRASLLQAALSGPVIGGTLGRFGSEVKALHAQLSRFQVDQQIGQVQLQAEIANQMTNCITAVTDVATVDVAAIAGKAAGASYTCINSFAQVGFAVQLGELERDQLKLESDQALAEFSGRVSDHVTTLQTEGYRLSQALEGIQRNLEIMEGLKSEAARAMQTAAWLLSRQAHNQPTISNRLDTLKVGHHIRYRRAFDNAKKMAFLAKRAVEMRLGMSLAEMVSDLPLVTAPATWEAKLCQSTGIDYQALALRGQGENFADAFLGEYVTKLENVVESYRLANNFHEGTDEVVVSLRDDVHNTRALCDSESPNRLYWASRLEPQFFLENQSGVGWTLSGCVNRTVETDEGVWSQPAGDCISVKRRNDVPFFNPLVGQPPVAAYDVDFGSPEWCDDPETCSYRAGAALSQTVELDAGRYRLSWYTADADGPGGADAVRVRRTDGTLFTVAEDQAGDPVEGVVQGINNEWDRIYLEFDVFETELVSIGFEKPSAMEYVVPLAAPMLEKLEDTFHVRTLRTPPRFMDTTEQRTAYLPVCEDTTGATFRADKWERGCLKLCPDGYSSECAERSRTECFWETSFNVSQRSIEAGHMFNQSGFARGNFNYRIRSMGVNFVGTNLRACEDSDLPSTCNAAGFIPYSVIHDGPYFVRNHKGQDYRLALFPGRIEHARGLGIERYVTNPIGETDRKLIEPYMRSELNGRPLDGEFILRVWDEPGVNFAAIQDVQIILDYGYWTRFN